MSMEDERATQAASRVGTMLREKWHIDSLLGMGGMASVYAATHRNQKRVAIKILHPELSVDASIRERFLREGYAANTVAHPGAVAVFDDDVTEDGAAFLVMEMLEGETLDARWERLGQALNPNEVLVLMDQLLDVLMAAHEKGIVHRDLKPENLFLTSDGVLKVLDFGIARLREMSNEGGQRTQMGWVMGTPAFMAPEQAKGRWDEVDGRTDLWAVGATMFTLLTGRQVHEAETVNEQLGMAMTLAAKPTASMKASLAPDICNVVDRALAFDKAARFPDAGAMQEAIRACLQSRALDPTQLSRTVPGLSMPGFVHSSTRTTGPLEANTEEPSKSAKPRSLVLGGVGLLGTAIALTLAMTTRQEPAQEPATLPKEPASVTAASLPLKEVEMVDAGKEEGEAADAEAPALVEAEPTKPESEVATPSPTPVVAKPKPKATPSPKPAAAPTPARKPSPKADDLFDRRR